MKSAVVLFATIGLLSMALGMRSMLRYQSGLGYDRESMDRALELEDQHAATPLVFRPTVQHALLLSYVSLLRDDTSHCTLCTNRVPKLAFLGVILGTSAYQGRSTGRSRGSITTSG